ncbi:hypothetical protein H8356DRAFT_1429184 [Neocallimastix lanati (nom. inval.)]|nr:hypothetical protein H8356DRAFT_1429184 [Neocallimastix sp. JGI-2020a]
MMDIIMDKSIFSFIGEYSRYLQPGLLLDNHSIINYINKSSSDTLTNCSTKGGSHSVTQGWAESNTTTSGVSDGWIKSNGYSDSYTTGHSETSNKEH